MSSITNMNTDAAVNSSVEEEEEDDDDEFQDALADLGHLTVNDQEEGLDQEERLSLSDPGLPVFETPSVELPKDLYSVSESFRSSHRPVRVEVDSTVGSVINQPPANNERSSDLNSAASVSKSGADCGSIFQSDNQTGNRSEQSLSGCSEFGTTDELLLNDAQTPVGARLKDNSALINEISSPNSSDVIDHVTSSETVVPPLASEVVPSSSGMDDFTCDLPPLSDDVMADDDDDDDTTDTEVDSEARVRPPVFEVDEEEDRVRRLESQWTEEEKEERKLEANGLKSRGNQAFKLGEFDKAEELYTQALSVCPTCFPNDRSIIYSNRSACKLRKGADEASLLDCTRALKLNPDYIKCLLRRAELYERSEKLDESLTDYKHVYELDRSVHVAAASIMRLEQLITERNERMKEEMLGQLKNLGNMILKPFGLSTDNFQLQQDPNSGGYSINFQR